MSYKGNSAPIPLGQLGLRTDDSMTSLPPNAAIKATNVDFFSSRLEKSRGTIKYNETALPAGVVAVFDWWPNASTQYVMAATSDKKLWRASGGTFAGIPVVNGMTTALPNSIDQSSWFVTGGQEAGTNAKKLFYISANNQVQVMSGTTPSFSDIANPATDWTGGVYPTCGCLFMNRMAMAAGHNIYMSKLADHTDFRTAGSGDTALLFPVFQGEGESIVAIQVYKGNLFIFKKPFGLYWININGSPDYADWSIQKLSDSFGVASSHAVIQPLDDLVAGNNTNSITSMQATQAFGDIKSGDILANNQVEQFYKTNFSTSGIPFMHAIYYAEKKKAYFTGRDTVATMQNQMLIIDVARQNARFSVDNKEQPTCLGLLKGSDNVPRPFYGADDGFVYRMEQPQYNVADAAYNAEFQTPYIDFSYLDATLGTKNKIFDFLEVQFIATGNWSFYVDVYVDNRFVETLNYLQSAGGALDSFVLDVDKLAVEYTQETRLPLHATGRRISFRIYNNNLNEYFRVEKLIVSFRTSAEQQSGISGTFSV